MHLFLLQFLPFLHLPLSEKSSNKRYHITILSCFRLILKSQLGIVKNKKEWQYLEFI